MHIGVTPINSGTYLDPGFVRSFAQQLEALGYESVWTFEHVIIPHDYESKYPYNPSGKIAIPADAGFTDPFIALTYIAGATEHLRLGTGINIFTQSNPLYFAKQASSIDHLSNGRLELGVGVGWLEEEFDALGVPFDRRGARADEYLDAMTAAWTGDDVEFHGEFVNWEGFQMLPRPAQRPRMPILIGGTTPPAIRRVVARGDGWYVIHRDLDHFKQLMEELRAECDAQGRDVSELQITAYWNHHREGLEGLEVYRDNGVRRLLVNVQALRMGAPEAAIAQFADEVLPACNEG